MSFVRVPGQGKRHPVRSRKTSAPKEWVSTVNDLSVHKLTPEEVSRRHELHRSQNRAVAKWELRERALRRRRAHAHPNSPGPLDRASISIIREVFSDNLQLQDVLARSDRAMAVVKDLFGDAPRRHTGFPSVTMAPDAASDADLPVLQRPDPPTQLSLLSQSLMDTEALNELDHLQDGDLHEETDSSSSFSFKPNMDTHRGNQRQRKAKPHTTRRLSQLKSCQATSGQQEAADNASQTPCTSGGAAAQAALNATMAVQRLRIKQSQMEPSEGGEHSVLVTQVLNPDHPLTLSGRKVRSSRATRGRSAGGSVLEGSNISSLTGNQSSLELLQGLLAQVETELDAVGPEQPVSRAPGPQPGSHSLTGFSVSLVSTLGRMASLLRQREEEVQREARERIRLEEEVREQRGLIDALTAETLALREESAALQAAVHQRTLALEQTVDTVVLALGGLGLLGAGGHYDPAESDSGTLGCDREPYYAVREPPVPPAVLLSPPRQRDSCQHSSVVRPLSFHQQTTHPGQSPSPAPSFCSLPRPSTTSTTSTTDHTLQEPNLATQDSMLAQIAELTRQNALIKTQLVRSGGQGSGRRSPREPGSRRGSGSSRRGSGSSSAGKEVPVSGPERQAPAPSTGRDTPQMDAERDRGPTPSRTELKVPQQTVECHGPCVSSMEQRLLELNRQSVAARSRLLELIEQQQQSSSAPESPSISPVPPPSLSPATGSGRTPESSVSLPEQDPSSDCSGDGRRPGSVASPQSAGTESRGAMPLGGRGEGWFALSTHVR